MVVATAPAATLPPHLLRLLRRNVVKSAIFFRHHHRHRRRRHLRRHRHLLWTMATTVTGTTMTATTIPTPAVGEASAKNVRCPLGRRVGRNQRVVRHD